jgi:hypothetical protein
MKAWLHAEDHARQIAFQYQIVFDRQQAAEMTENNAHEVMRGAERDYPEYTWEIVKVSAGRNVFVVEGTQKK